MYPQYLKTIMLRGTQVWTFTRKMWTKLQQSTENNGKTNAAYNQIEMSAREQ